MTLPFVDEQISGAIARMLKVDTIPELQTKTKSDSSLLEKALLPFLEPAQIEIVSLRLMCWREVLWFAK